MKSWRRGLEQQGKSGQSVVALQYALLGAALGKKGIRGYHRAVGVTDPFATDISLKVTINFFTNMHITPKSLCQSLMRSKGYTRKRGYKFSSKIDNSRTGYKLFLLTRLLLALRDPPCLQIKVVLSSSSTLLLVYRLNPASPQHSKIA
ncbi:hypothetical protein BDB01DRAFT_849186 [Pilobolus umbonatus]|nr:hypothetical protein BDB01DRAFT_849186 [Pilobolus umbonatus]